MEEHVFDRSFVLLTCPHPVGPRRVNGSPTDSRRGIGDLAISLVFGVCVIWTIVPWGVVPRAVSITVVTPISVVSRSVPIGAAAAQQRRYKKNHQDNQQGFSHGLAPLGLLLKSGRGVFFAPVVKTMRWGRFIQWCG